MGVNVHLGVIIKSKVIVFDQFGPFNLVFSHPVFLSFS